MARHDNPHNKNPESASPSAEINASKTGAFGENGGSRADAQSSGGTDAHGGAAQSRRATSGSRSGTASDYSQTLQSRAESLLQDFRFALRTLRKSLGFTLTTVLTLALGIGANTAIFQLVDAVRLRSLPVADPATLAAVRVKSGTRGFGITSGGDFDTMLSYPMWEQIRLHQQSFSN